MVTTIAFLLCWLTIALARRTPVGRLLQRIMVETPAAALNRVEPGHVALAVVVTVLIMVHLNAGGESPIRMASMIAPEAALWLASIEFGVVVEALATLGGVVVALRRSGSVAAFLAIPLRVLRPSRNRAARARRATRTGFAPPANDNDGGTASAIASLAGDLRWNGRCRERRGLRAKAHRMSSTPYAEWPPLIDAVPFRSSGNTPRKVAGRMKDGVATA